LAHWPMSSSKPTSPSAPCAPLATKRTLLLTSAGLAPAGSQAGLAPTGSHQLAAGAPIRSPRRHAEGRTPEC
jgi:hypothetical protein